MTNKNTLKQRVIRGGIWSIAGHFISQVIRLGANLITTRLLMPEMFGVMAIANTLFIGIHMFSDFGIRQNIVQSARGDDPLFLNTAWTLQILRGLLLALLILLLSGLLLLAGHLAWFPVDSAYSDPALPKVIAMLSFMAILGGMESTKMATVSRQLTLGRLTLLEIISQFAGPAVIIIWCLFDRSIWALVAGWFAVSFSKMLLSHLMLPGIGNKLTWDKEIFKSLYHFGKWIFLSSILGFMLNNGDRILFGVYLTSSQLGIYSIAFLMISAMVELLRKLISGISFPALSEIYRNEPHRLGNTYYRFRLPIDLVSLFMLGFVLTGGQTLIDFLYDDRYRDAGWMLQILAASLFFTRYEVAGLCYLVLNKPKLLSMLNFIRVIGLYILVPLAFEFLNFKWALGIVAANNFLALPLMFYFNYSNDLLNIRKELIVLPIIFIGVLSGYVFSLALPKLVEWISSVI